VAYKVIVRRLLHGFGYDISRFDANEPGRNPFADMERFVTDAPSTTIFDISANVGQSIERFRLHYPTDQFHSFEPTPTAYQELAARAKSCCNVSTWYFAFDAAPGRSMPQENERSVVSSMLELGEKGWGQVEKQTEVEPKPIDEVCTSQGVARVDILKSDTKDYDLEALRGAEGMFRREPHRLGPVRGEYLRVLSQVASWTDALFANKARCRKKVV
jgi:FkbM family methyltransferase